MLPASTWYTASPRPRRPSRPPWPRAASRPRFPPTATASSCRPAPAGARHPAVLSSLGFGRRVEGSRTLSGKEAGMALLQMLTRHLVVAIPVTMLLGLAFGAVAPVGWLGALVIPLTLLMIYPMMVNLKLRQLLEGGDNRALGLAQLINFAIIPFVAFGLGLWWFGDQPYLALGLLLAALLPTSGMTISWTGFAKGNLPAAVKMTVVGLILGSLATPFYVKWLMGASIPVDLVGVFRQILRWWACRCWPASSPATSSSGATACRASRRSGRRASRPFPPWVCWASSSWPWRSRRTSCWPAPSC